MKLINFTELLEEGHCREVLRSVLPSSWQTQAHVLNLFSCHISLALPGSTNQTAFSYGHPAPESRGR